MIAIKIQCGCGQRYAFDVEPISGRLPAPVFCPVCRTDGTMAANTILAERLQAEPAMAGVAARVSVPNGSPVPSVQIPAAPLSTPRIGLPASAVRVSTAVTAPAAVVAAAPAVTHAAPAHQVSPPQKKLLPGQLEPDKAAAEARSKIMWGDEQAEVVKFLMSHGFSAEDAKVTIAPLLIERAQAVRKAGIHKIFVGIGMICVPIVAFIVCFVSGYYPIKLLGLAGAVGLWGMTKVLSGILMVLSPKSEKGDVSEM